MRDVHSIEIDLAYWQKEFDSYTARLEGVREDVIMKHLIELRATSSLRLAELRGELAVAKAAQRNTD